MGSMKEAKTTIESFTAEEKKLISAAVEVSKKDRAYSDRPRFYHDMVLRGCESLLKKKH